MIAGTVLYRHHWNHAFPFAGWSRLLDIGEAANFARSRDGIQARNHTTNILECTYSLFLVYLAMPNPPSIATPCSISFENQNH